MAKANCTISIANFGAVRVKALRATHGVSIVAYNGGGQSRHGEVFYPSKRTSGSFELVLKFSTFEGYERVGIWLQRYMVWAGNQRALATPVRVQIPSRRFDKIGALETGPSFGDKVAATTYEMNLGFVGARDPMAMGGTYVSRFRPPRIKDPAAEYFYPAGTQLSGQQNGWDVAYDHTPDESIPEDLPISLPEINLPEW